MVAKSSTASPCLANRPVSSATHIGPSSPEEKVATIRNGVNGAACTAAAPAAGVTAGVAGLADSEAAHAAPSIRMIKPLVTTNIRRSLPTCSRLPRGYTISDTFPLTDKVETRRVEDVSLSPGWPERLRQFSDLGLSRFLAGRLVLAEVLHRELAVLVLEHRA